MFRKLINFLSRKDSAFRERFLPAHQTFVLKVACYRIVKDDVINRIANELNYFCDRNFYSLRSLFCEPFLDGKPLFSSDELEEIGPSDGHRMYCFHLLGLISHSLFAYPEAREAFFDLYERSVEPSILETSRKLMAFYRGADIETTTTIFTDVLAEFIPRVKDIFLRQLVITKTVSVITSLKQHAEEHL